MDDAADGDLAVAVDDAPPWHVGVIRERMKRVADTARSARVSEQRGDAAIADDPAMRDAPDHSIDASRKRSHGPKVFDCTDGRTTGPQEPFIVWWW